MDTAVIEGRCGCSGFDTLSMATSKCVQTSKNIPMMNVKDLQTKPINA